MVRSTLKGALALAALAAATAAGAAWPDAARADEPITLRVATVAPDRTPWADLLNLYKRDVERRSEGRVRVRPLLGGVRGDEQSIVRQIYRGDLQGGGVSTGAMSVLVQDMDILELPFLFDSAEQADAILDGPARPHIEALLEERGFKLLMYSENGYRSFGTRFGFVKSPADLRAKRMRSQESPVHVETYRALGASPVAISVSEVLPAIQTGVVEGFDNTPLFTFAAGWYQAVSHYTVSKHSFQPALFVVNKAWFDAQPREVQRALLAPTRRLQQRGREAVRSLDPLLLESLGEHGVEVYHLSDSERDAFRAATRPVWDTRRESATDAGKALLDAIIQAREEE